MNSQQIKKNKLKNDLFLFYFELKMANVAQETVNLLNLLGQCYTPLFGFVGDNYIPEDLDDEFLMDILNTEYEKEHYDVRFEGDDINIIIFKKWFLEEKSKIELPYESIILKFPNDYWVNGKPYLLNKPDKIYEWYNDCTNPENNISSRDYITINTMYEKITISSKIKGSPITIEDILFATRGMCLDGSRDVVDMSEGGYKIKSRIGTGLLILVKGGIPPFNWKLRF